MMEKWDLNAAESVMIGDRKYDVQGAQVNGMDSIAVGYGYGSVDELSLTKPTFFCGTVEELAKLF